MGMEMAHVQRTDRLRAAGIQAVKCILAQCLRVCPPMSCACAARPFCLRPVQHAQMRKKLMKDFCENIVLVERKSCSLPC